MAKVVFCSFRKNNCQLQLCLRGQKGLIIMSINLCSCLILMALERLWLILTMFTMSKDSNLLFNILSKNIPIGKCLRLASSMELIYLLILLLIILIFFSLLYLSVIHLTLKLLRKNYKKILFGSIFYTMI